MRRGALHASLLATGLLLAAPAWAADSIVPPAERIDDIQARLDYARILAYRPDTLAQSVAEYERVLREAPHHAAALAELAELRIRQGDLPAAEARLRAALAADAANPAAVAPLARLLLWTNRPADGETLLQRTRAARPLTAEEQLVDAQTLSRLGRHDEADRAFAALLAADANPSAEILSACADAALAGGRLTEARELYRRALAVKPDLAGAQRGYALTLAWTGDATAARPRLEGALRTDPRDVDVIHTYVETVANQDGIGNAATLARQRAEAAPRDAAWRTEWAELETRRGHAVHARQLFAEARQLGDTPELRLRAGRAAISWGDFNVAEAALREALQREPANPLIRDELGRLLISADRYEEAEQFFERWLAEAPDAEAPLHAVIQLRLRAKDFPAALGRADAALAIRPSDSAALRMRGEALLALHRYVEASEAFARLATITPADRVTAEVMQGRIARTAGQREEAARHFSLAADMDPAAPAPRFFAALDDRTATANLLQRVTAAGGERPTLSAPELAAWAGLFAETGRFDDAIACLQAARRADPEYYPAWAQLAEFLAIDGQFGAAAREFAALKAAMPDNRQVLLNEARALAWSRQYEPALTAYAYLARLNPADPVPRREAARTAGWGKLRERGAALYATAWADEAVDRTLAAQLSRLLDGAGDAAEVVRWREWATHPTFGDEPFAATERWTTERFALRAALPAASQPALDQLYLDVLPTLLLQRAWWLENHAKQFAWDRRYASAESTFQRLLIVEPGNEEAWFDLSQAQAAQGLGAREHATLVRLLELDANHTLANHAVQRRVIRSRPLADLEARVWREHGRGDLANLRRTVLTGALQDTVADQVNVRASGQLGREIPLTGGQYAFRGEGLDVDGVANTWLSGSAGFVHREFYDSRIGHTDTGQAQVWLKHDSYGVGAGFERRDEIANRFALFQGTQSDNTWVGGMAAVNRRLDVNARLTSARYSDANRGVGLLVQPAYAWTDHPRVFKTTLTLEYRDTDEASVYTRDTAGRLVALTHPYWTPRDYTHAAVTFEWFEDRAREFFVGSAEESYDLRATFGVDSESNPAATFEGDWNDEWWDQWVAHASGYVNFSREWDAIGVRLRLTRRF